MNLQHWVVCLDLSKIDPILIRYVNYLADKLKPETVTFFHVLETSSVSGDLLEMFPEFNNLDDLEINIEKKLSDKIESNFKYSESKTELVIHSGKPTDRIIEFVNSRNTDLLIMGKKTGYKGEGVIPRKIIKYVVSSILFVPESSRYSLKQALVQVDFSSQSAKAVKFACEITGPAEGQVTAQHIFTYPARFFPAIPTKEVMKKMDDHLSEKKSDFIQEYKLDEGVNFAFSLHRKGEKMDEIYDQISRDQTDIIFAASKSDKKLKSIFRDDFIDKMVNYMFGVPVFILKNKTKHKKFIDSLFGS
ncbi:MAG: universal stress protein [Balneolaceae bacterium]